MVPSDSVNRARPSAVRGGCRLAKCVGQSTEFQGALAGGAGELEIH